MFELTARQRIACLVLLFFLALGGTLLFISHNTQNTVQIEDEGNEALISVYMSGAVAKPAVVSLKPGTRVVEALKKAGGALSDADLNQVNLAAFVEDGEQIYIPKKGEIIPETIRKKAATKQSKKAATPKEIKLAGPVDLNTATQKQLEAIPGIGPALATRIIQYRTGYGKFSTYEDLQNVNGVGESKLEKFRPYLFVK